MKKPIKYSLMALTVALLLPLTVGQVKAYVNPVGNDHPVMTKPQISVTRAVRPTRPTDMPDKQNGRRPDMLDPSTITGLNEALRNGSLAEEKLDLIKEKVIQGIDKQLQVMERVRERFQNNNRLTDEMKKDLNNTIDLAVTELNRLKLQVQNAQSLEEIRDLLKQARQTYTNKLQELKVQALNKYGKDVLDRLVSRAEKINAKVREVLFKLEENGVDTTEAKSKFDEALTHYQKAKDLATSLLSETDPESIKATLKEVRGEVKLYLQNIRELVGMLKELKPSITATGLPTNTIKEPSVTVPTTPEL